MAAQHTLHDVERDFVTEEEALRAVMARLRGAAREAAVEAERRQRRGARGRA
jgi:hypothetical protein